ncbi:MAG: hypothetical protein K1V89_09640, partial [Muribaculaceae bacterium]
FFFRYGANREIYISICGVSVICLRDSIYDIRVHELWKDSYNLRAVREGDTLHLLVDGRETATLPALKAPSTIGLLTTAGTPEYHGTLYYHK